MTTQPSLPGLELPAAPDLIQRLAAGFHTAAFFDIETAGLAAGSPVTLIVAQRAGRPHTFVLGENLDDFLDWLDGVELLVSFNGATFDVPRVLGHFRIPALPCAHLDLREVAKRVGLRGGLKKIEKELGIERPADLQGLTGEDADWMWRAWARDRDASMRDRLIRYCQADVHGLQVLAERLLGRLGVAVAAPGEAPYARPADTVPRLPPPPAAAVEADALYLRLRDRARRMRTASAEQMAQGALSQPRAGQNARP